MSTNVYPVQFPVVSCNMLPFYKRSLISLFNQVQLLRANTYGEGEICLSIQETLIKKITHIERKIRKLQVLTANFQKRLRSQQPARLSRAEAKAIKKEISRHRHKIDEYRQLLIIIRDIGDALAFTYIDKWDIKPLAFKQSPGFISQKAGLRRELELLRGAFALGRIAILNDLTNCLRYGDLSILKDGKFCIFEVKSSKSGGSRTQRQSTEARKISDYISKGDTESLYGIKGEFRRISSYSQEEHHRDQLNTIISDAKKNGTSYAEVEKGLYYLVLTKFRPDPLEILLNKCESEPIVSLINHAKYDNVGYYPFTLSIHDSEALYEFYCDKLIIIVFMDFEAVEKKFRSQDLGVELLRDEDWIIEVVNLNRAEGEVESLKVSRHLFNRLFVEFLSLDWFSKEVIHLFQGAIQNAT